MDERLHPLTLSDDSCDAVETSCAPTDCEACDKPCPFRAIILASRDKRPTETAQANGSLMITAS